ncbi:MAG: lytic transglycosylase domain-containing protein [Rikenellaceae bacterium]
MKKIIIIIIIITLQLPLLLYAKQDVVPSSTSSVQIYKMPNKMSFAGEEVPVHLPYVREAIEREVLTTTCMHTTTMLTLRAMSRYFPVIEPILAEYGVPEDFKYLAMAESGLNPNATSHARAAGLWQFLSSAAGDYGLETGENTDLRFHIEQSTRAACRYLLAAYELFGSWTLAAASYNAGRSGVLRRLTIQGVDNYWDLYLPEEAMRYVPRMVALKLVSSDPAAYNFELREEDKLQPFKNYKIIEVNSPDIDWSKLAAEHGTNYRQLRILNPWIRSYEYKNIGGTTYEVMIPTEGFKELGY